MSFAEAGRKMLEGVGAGLYEGGTIIMAQSSVLVPVESATLKRSGRVEEPVIEGDSMTVTVGYGYGEEYAAKAEGDGDEAVGHGYGYWVHERVYTSKPARIRTPSGRVIAIRLNTGRKVYHKPPTQAHFLSIPAEAFRPEMSSVIEHNVKAKLRS